MIEGLCMPALIYLVYATTRIIIDAYKGLYNLAFVQVWITILFVYLLNVMCRAGFGIISWIVVSIPFLLMSVIAAVLLFVFGLNPATGKAVYAPQATPPASGSENNAQVNTVGYTTTSAPPSNSAQAIPSAQPATSNITSSQPPTSTSAQPTTSSSAQPTTSTSAQPTTSTSAQPSAATSEQPSAATSTASQPTIFNQHPMTNSPLPISVHVEKFTPYNAVWGRNTVPTPYG